LKMWQRENQTYWNVKHNLCYWMSNRPVVRSDFSKLQYTFR
jgi:hypothetical protein